MKSITFLTLTLLFLYCVLQINADSTNRQNSKAFRESAAVDQNDDDDDEDRKVPHLYPHLIKLFATGIGASDAQVNRTVDRWVDRFNGIDPDATTTKAPPTPLPSKETTPADKKEIEIDEDEDEDGDEDSRRRE